MKAIRLTVTGAPRTKKTHSQIVRAGKKPRLLPSIQWRRWVKTAEIVMPYKWDCRNPNWSGMSLPLTVAVNCRALFYRDANRGDAVGYYQGLADLLEKRGIVENDRLITQWDGSRLLVDRKNPRVELELEPVT